jgi:hypothetical protein
MAHQINSPSVYSGICSPKSFRGLEAGAGIEPANSGFADRDLTTWLPRHLRGDASIQHTGKVSMLLRDLRKVDRDP